MIEYFWSQFFDRCVDTLTVILILAYAVIWVVMKGDDEK